MEFVQEFPVKDLRLFHKNPRKGNVDAIVDSINIHGLYKPIVINKGTHTGRPNEVLAGNHTTLAIRKLKWQTVPVTIVDFDDDQAMRVVLIDNKTSDDSSYNVDVLTDVLQDLEDLKGTGYTDADLDKLLNGLDDGEDGDPKDSEHEETYNNRWELVIELDNEEQQRDMYQKLTEEGHRVRVLSL